jgi:hypothetical protein
MTDQEKHYCTKCGSELIFKKAQGDDFDADTGKRKMYYVWQCPSFGYDIWGLHNFHTARAYAASDGSKPNFKLAY